MLVDGKDTLRDILAGRSVSGYHISRADGEKLKQDPKYKLLTKKQKSLLENLINPV